MSASESGGSRGKPMTVARRVALAARARAVRTQRWVEAGRTRVVTRLRNETRRCST